MSDTGDPPDVVSAALTARSFVALMVSGTELFELNSQVNVAWEQVLMFDGGVEKIRGPDCVADVAVAVAELVLEVDSDSESVAVVVMIEDETMTEEDGDGLEEVEGAAELELEPSSSSPPPSPSCFALVHRASVKVRIKGKRICSVTRIIQDEHILERSRSPQKIQ